MNTIRLLKGDCLDKLKELQDNSIDSVVTDPPYEIGFMGKGWDDSGIANNTELWKEVLRVLKPGGHLLSFSHSRTYHRQAVAVEDAGFEIRDQLMWIYGSGFPKSHNIGKSVDKLNGIEAESKFYNEKEDTRNVKNNANPNARICKKCKGTSWCADTKYCKAEDGECIEPWKTTSNNKYQGWGTALKPAHEPIVMARKPLSEKTIVKNVLEWGTGGINVDASRIGSDKVLSHYAGSSASETYGWNRGEKKESGKDYYNNEGRFPANIIFDEEAGKILDEQSGIRKTGGVKTQVDNGANQPINLGGGLTKPREASEGGASRFFYCPKASKKDRNDGCDELEEKQSAHSVADKCGKCGKFLGASANVCKCEKPERVGISSKNNHPTVKPTDLMAYLVRMVTPKGGTVLDPFMGSGSTGKACVREGFDFIGIEREDEYMEIAKTRIEYEQKKNKHTQFFDI